MVRGAVLVLVLALCSAPCGLAQTATPASSDGAVRAAFSLDALLGRLARVREVEGRFQEKRWTALLDRPLESSGVLRYRAPDYLLRQTEQPRREVFEIEGGRLTVDHPEHGHVVMALSDQPALQAFAASLRGVLSGDLIELKSWYRVEPSGDWDAWRLRLIPQKLGPAADLAKLVEYIEVRGQNAALTELETVETDGDRSLMVVTPGGAGG